MKLAYVIYTYDRIHDALVQMEIVRHLWEKKFGKIEIIHVYNGEDEWYPQKTLEDYLLKISNPGHFEGASNLIDEGIKKALELDCDYVVVSASDTWLIDEIFIHEKVKLMENESKFLFTCPWGNPEMNNPQDVGFATDFFILDANWENKNNTFPLRYADFREKHLELLRYLGKGNVMVERLFFSRFLTACNKDVNENSLKSYALSKILLFNERTPVHYTNDWKRTKEFPEIGLYMNHEMEEKKEMLNNRGIVLGKYTEMYKNGNFIKN
ncbi:MAG: hypothetical protein PHS92_00935 [Candidatus Gracilibacteria bacterium]|nr:hypothetical protein [Candidatus Gracilibacteria bacterium]